MDSFTFRIDEDLLHQARELAEAQHTTVTQLLIDGLIAEINRRSLLSAQPMRRIGIIGALDIPCPNDMVISVHGAHSGVGAGVAVVDVRSVDDVTTIPINAYRRQARNVQLICTEAQFEPLMAYIGATTGLTTTHKS